MQSDQTKLLAFALYEIRVLLAGYLGSATDAPMSVRLAAHIAYALHNDADAVMEDGDFDLKASLSRIAAIDQILDMKEASALVNRFDARG